MARAGATGHLRELQFRQWRRIFAEERKRRGWDADEAGRRRKGDDEKVKMAARLRAETTMTWGWIAQELNLGARGSAANWLRLSSPEPRTCDYAGATPSRLDMKFGKEHFYTINALRV